MPQCTAESSALAVMTLGGAICLVVVGTILWRRYGEKLSAWGKSFRVRQFNLAKEGK